MSARGSAPPALIDGYPPGALLGPTAIQNLLLIAVLAGALLTAVSNQSFWIDETVTGWVARQPTLHSWWQELVDFRGSDIQMPLYMFYVWAVAQVFGFSELTLRLAGLPWLFAGGAAVILAAHDLRERVVVALVISTSAFVWYYAGEARPYAMQLGASCLVAAALKQFAEDRLPQRDHSRWLFVFLAGLVVLCGSSLLGMIWASAGVAAAWVLLPRERQATYWRVHRLACVLTAVCLVGLAAFYAWTLLLGARASATASTNWQTVAFIFYEQLGLMGLGPGRSELRESGFRALSAYAPVILLYSGCLAVVMVAAILATIKSQARVRIGWLAVIITMPALLLIAAAFATHFRLLGRHWTPLMPVWLLLMAAGLSSLWQSRRVAGRAVVTGFLALSLWSAADLRFAPRHTRDDYRRAAACAKTALGAGDVVWWNASEPGAHFYDVPVSVGQFQAIDRANLIVSPSASTLSGVPRPDVIITTKPDVFDTQGVVGQYIQDQRYHQLSAFAAFTVWSTGSHPSC